ncbi:MAG: 4Fe-4S dicluster domain-containing protein [Planctomycetota bacterium]
MAKAILYDSTRCVQCGRCETACRVINDLPEEAPHRLSEHRFTVLEEHNGHPVRRMCMHCEDPACASVCPVAALKKTKEGPVSYDPSACMGCRYCVMACPFNVPRYEWSSAIPKVRKCEMCVDRVQDGKAPNCTRFCPADAIRFGDRDELLAEAKGRIAGKPDRYHDYVYGEKEAGGTSVMIIGAVPPAELGLPIDVPKEALPVRTWQVLSRLPGVVVGAAAFLLGTWWVIERRNKLSDETASAATKDRVPQKRLEEREERLEIRS